MLLQKIGFGGGCHWCTEAYFQSLKGVEKVEQGWISSAAPDESFSEAVVVHYNPAIIPLQILISIHLHTHAATRQHRFRSKYRSAVYFFDGNTAAGQALISNCQQDFEEPLITQALQFRQFKLNDEQYQQYFEKNKAGIFCGRYIHPKLQQIERDYATYYKGI